MRFVIALAILTVAIAVADEKVCGNNKFVKWENECTALCHKSVERDMDILTVPVHLVAVGKACGGGGKCQYGSKVGVGECVF